MPIINIKSLPVGKRINTSKILTKICKKTAKEIGYRPEHMWATWEFLQPKNYAVGNKLSKRQVKTTHSPIVRILSFEGKLQSHAKKLMTKIAEILSKELKIDIGNIFIEYSEASSGKVFDGGQVVYSKPKQNKRR
jgi:phenylpyruvate tautomerase PptA (4-oxalocrotonate tautomerase family)